MTMTQERAASLVVWLLLAAVALVGVAHLAFLPPWEGFDEPAHWSYVQELVDTGHPPRYGADGFSRDIDRYPGPFAYRGVAPFDDVRLTLRGFHDQGAPRLAGGPTRFRSDPAQLNWQAQHPPLFYLLMTPVYRATRGLGWVDNLFALRLAAFALAFTGFALGVLGTRAAARTRYGPWVGPIMAAWPFLVPQFFPEFARLGNDSLCLLFAAAAWVALARLLLKGGGWGASAALGVALGLGLLTKAFFLPIGAGFGLVLLLRWWRGGRRADWLAQMLLAGGLALLVGGWWYALKALETGSITGSDEFIQLHRQGGWRLIAQHFSMGELTAGLLVMGATFVWAGSYSLARLSEAYLIAPALLLVIALADYLRRLEREGGLLALSPILLAAPMLAGLGYHVLVWMAGAGAMTPGWYMHILAAPLGFALALGWRRPRLLGALAAATVAYTAVAWAFQLSMFSGCAAKLGSDTHYSLQGAACFIDVHALERLGHPALGAATLAMGIAAGLAAAALALRCRMARVSGSA